MALKNTNNNGIICEPQYESWEPEVDPLKEQVLLST